jgi:hypothetical protein
MLSPRVQQILATAQMLDPATQRPDEDSMLKALEANTPRATYKEAWEDTDGTSARFPLEILRLIFPAVDFDQETPEVVEEMIKKVYGAYMSTTATGPLQSSLNGDGRSVLCEASPRRNGSRRRGARFITDDPVACLAMNRLRLKTVVTTATTASNTRRMVVTRQPELTDAVNRMFAQTTQEVVLILAPVGPDGNPALGSGAPVSTPPAAPPAATGGN